MSSRITLLLTLVLLLLAPAGMAFAQDYDPAATLAAIENDKATGAITVDQAALQMTYSVVDPAKVDTKFYRSAMTAPRFCGTPALIQLQNLLPLVSPATREMIDGLLLPGDRRGDTPPLGAATLADNPDGVALPNVYYSQHFAIRWGDSYAADLARIEEWSDALEDEIWATEVVDWGYPAVYATDEYYVDYYIGNSGSGAPEIGFSGAYTTVYQGTYQPYMVIYPDILNYLDSLRDISSHEFFHTIQFTLGVTGQTQYMWDNNGLWWVEGTAVWAESVVYPELGSWFYYIYEWAHNAEQALTDQGNGTEYGRVVWARYLYEFHGGLDAIYDIWVNGAGTSALFGGTGYLSGLDVTWKEAWTDFVYKVLAEEFESSDHIPSFSSFRTVATYPYAHWEVPAGSMPHINSLHMLQVRPGDSDDPKLNVRFVGEQITLSATEWFLTAYKKTFDGTIDIEELDLGKADSGDFTIDGLGTTYDRIYLLVTPLSGTEDNASARWDYQLQMTRGDDPFQDPPDPGDDDDDTAGDDDDDTTGDDDDTTGDDDDDDDDDAAPADDDDDDDDDDSGCGC
jgi:hypothetical protein